MASSKTVLAFDVKRSYDLLTKYCRDINYKGEVLEYDNFVKQLKRKDYFIASGHNVALLQAEHSTTRHAVKCYLLDPLKLSTSADVTNLIARSSITLESEKVIQQTCIDDIFPN